MNNKVCILTSVHPYFDGRIFHKEAKTLLKAGYDVVIIAQHNKEETVDGIRIVPLSKPKNRFERMTKVVWFLFRLALKEKADIYHFHDPELIPVGILYKLFSKKVIYDVHEDVSKQILYKDWVGNIYIRKFVAFVVTIIEKIGALLFDGIIVVTPAIAKKFNPSKIALIINSPIISLIDSTTALKTKKQKSIIIYTGGLSRIRGIREIIQSMQFIGDKAELWLLGKWISDIFKKECENLEGWKYTKYFGIVTLGKVYQYMKIADIGISVLYPVKNYFVSLPVKAFEYMACSLPIIMSSFPYWQEVFESCALFVNPYDSEDIADKISYLLNNSDHAEKLGKKGEQLVREKYNWDTEGKKLVNLYGELLNPQKVN